MLRPNYECLGAQCIKCCTNSYTCPHTIFNLCKNYSQMRDPNVLHLLQRFLVALMKALIILSILFFNEATFHTRCWASRFFLLKITYTYIKINRHNIQILGSEHPHLAIKHKRESSKVNVWYGLMHDKVIFRLMDPPY